MDRGQLFRGLWKNQTAGISDHRNIIEIILLGVLSPKRSAILFTILFHVVIKSRTNMCKSKNQAGITRAAHQRCVRFTTAPA